MEVKPFKQFQQRAAVEKAVLLAIWIACGFFSWKVYSLTGMYSFNILVPLIIAFFVSFLCATFLKTFLVRCPRCKTLLWASYDNQENEWEEWTQLQFPCPKCGILWDTQERSNVNDRYHGSS